MMPLEPKQRPPLMNDKQVAILKALVKRNPDGSLLDIWQLMKAVRPDGSRGAMLLSMRHLHMHGLVTEDDLVLRRKRRVRTFRATENGAQLVKPGQISG